MKMNELEILKAKVRDIVNTKLEGCTTSIKPTAYGEQIYDDLSSEEVERLSKHQNTILKFLFIKAVETQTKSHVEDIQQGFWPTEDWISGIEGLRIKYRHAKWADHLAHRENQITAMRRANVSFEVNEQRRQELKEAGMGDDPEMTTEQAIAKITGSKDE